MPEKIIGRIASGQYGNVTRKQLLGAEIESAAIDRRIKRGQLIPQHAGVYRVGHAAQAPKRRTWRRCWRLAMARCWAAGLPAI